MKAFKAVLLALALVILSAELDASGQVGIYAIIEKVTLEPNDSAPEQIQIWGAFTLTENGATLTPRRGYMYFSVPPLANAAQKQAIVKEWKDLKSVAGTGQAVAFGLVGYIGAFSDELISRPAGMPPYLLVPTARSNYSSSRNILRPETETPPATPDPYITNVGVTKLPGAGNLSVVVDKLKAALKP